MVSYNSSSGSGRSLKKPTSQGQPVSGPRQANVYKVKPVHFRELVQRLTGSQIEPRTQSQSQPRRDTLQSIAPPPLSLNPHQLHLQNQYNETSFMERQVEYACNNRVEQVLPKEHKPFANNMEGEDGSTELTLSPNFQAWFSYNMMNPGQTPASQMDQRSVF